MSDMQIYVGTYAKYNSGSIAGAWIDLSKHDESSFWDACAKLHSDESDPELMFQDWEGIPSDYICESGLSSEFWEYLEFLDVTHLEAEAVAAGLSLSIPLDKLEDAYSGKYSSDEEFAMDLADSCGMVPDDLSWPCKCIDWELAARDLMYDYSEESGYYFSSNW